MAQYDTTWFEKGLAELEITLNEKQIEQFLTYYELLVEWNKVMNLTAITEYEEVITKHFLDSVASVKVCDYSKPMKILDLGTGAGFPGIPLKIVFPDQEIVLLDSLNKRVGIFKNKENADRMNYELLDKGYPSYILQQDGYYKVQVGAFEQLGNAVLMEQRLRRDGYQTLITTR